MDISKRTILSCVLLGISLVAVSAGHAKEVSIGPSVSYVNSSSDMSGMSYGFDLTYIHPTAKTVLWASAGLRAIDANDSYGAAYVEMGTWLLANVGIGYTQLFGNDHLSRHNVHAFIGVPIPIYGIGKCDKPGFYLEPYFRQVFTLDGDTNGAGNEVGVLLKYTNAKVWADCREKSDIQDNQR